MIFGSIIAAGVIGVLIAPIASRMLRFFPPVVTGTIILVIGITLMRVGINWIFGVPVGPTAPHLVSPEHAAWLEQVTALGGAVPAAAGRLQAGADAGQPACADLEHHPVDDRARRRHGHRPLRQGLPVQHRRAPRDHHRRRDRGGPRDDALRQGRRGSLVRADHPVPLRHADLRAGADRHHDPGDDRDPDRVDRHVPRALRPHRQNADPAALRPGLRMDGLGTIIGGVFNTFPYTSFSQNVGLVGVTGVRSRYVCVAGGSSWWCSG